MQAQDIMTRNVVTITADMAVRDVAALLLEKHISAVPVVDGHDKLIGIVSEGDLVRRPEIAGEKRGSWWLDVISKESDRASDHLKAHGRTAGQVMTANVASVDENTPVAVVAQLLETRRIKRVPVLRDGTVVGILSRADLLRVLMMQPEVLAQTPEDVRADDRKIRAAVEQTIHDIRSDAMLMNVIVDGGTVHLWGMVDEPETRAAMVAAAEGCEGVGQVDGHFIRVPTWA